MLLSGLSTSGAISPLQRRRADLDANPPDNYVRPILVGLHSGLERGAGATQVAAVVGQREPRCLWIYDPQQLLAPWKIAMRTSLESADFVLSDEARDLRYRHTQYLRPKGFLSGIDSEVEGGNATLPPPASSALQGRKLQIVQVFARVLGGRLFHDAGLRSFLNTATRILIAGLEGRDTEVVRYGRFELEGHSKFAVRRQIKALVRETSFSISKALSAVSRISRAREEGASPRGLLLLADVDSLEDDRITVAIAKNRPRLENPKHICKLLLGTSSDQELVPGPLADVHGVISDGESVLGLFDGAPPDPSVVVQFTGQSGSIFCASDAKLTQAARFSGFQFFLTEETPPSTILQEVLAQGARADHFVHRGELIEHVVHLSKEAQGARRGCTIVLGEPKKPWTSGQRLRNPLRLSEGQNRRVAAKLSAIDGAIQVDRRNCLVAFGGLLDGDEFPEAEDLARGGRYNSASRFTKARDDVVVVVVSADGPVTIFSDGRARRAEEKLDNSSLDPALVQGVSMNSWLAT